MKKKKIIWISIAVLVLINVVVAVILITNDKKNSKKKDFTYMGIYDEKIIEEDNYIFTNYDDYYGIFEDNEFSKRDFKNNNFVLVTINFDTCSEKNIKPVSYDIDGNDIDVKVTYKGRCNWCEEKYMYYLLKVDKSVKKADVYVDAQMTNVLDCEPSVDKKPLIYLYPEKETKVTVKLGYPKLLTASYPTYSDGWDVIAKPNGDLVDKSGRTYYGLYWEGKNSIKEDFKDGFIVEKNNISSFLEEKLKILGLNEREANEFIIYWLPILQKNEYNLIRFEEIGTINEQMPLDITPTPDTTIRVLMEYKPVNNKVKIKEQKLTTPTRKGFTVVEWGGTLIEN